MKVAHFLIFFGSSNFFVKCFLYKHLVMRKIRVWKSVLSTFKKKSQKKSKNHFFSKYNFKSL